MKTRNLRHIELARRGVTSGKRREAILDAEDEALRRRELSVFELLREDDFQREQLSRGRNAFHLQELSLPETTRDDAPPGTPLISEAVN